MIVWVDVAYLTKPLVLSRASSSLVPCKFPQWSFPPKRTIEPTSVYSSIPKKTVVENWFVVVAPQPFGREKRYLPKSSQERDTAFVGADITLFFADERSTLAVHVLDRLQRCRLLRVHCTACWVRRLLYAPRLLPLHFLNRSEKSIFRYRRHTEFRGHTAQKRQLQLQRLPVEVAGGAAVGVVGAVVV